MFEPMFDNVTRIDNYYGILAIVKVGEKYGYIKSDGTYFIEPIFDKANDFNKGFAFVILDGKRRYVNSAGEIKSKRNS